MPSNSSGACDRDHRIVEVTRSSRQPRGLVIVPNDFVAEVHDRMPVLLTKEQFAPWLTGEAGAEYLKPASNDYLQRWPVSKRSITCTRTLLMRR
jgi:putative SOS response-associated peptidase YedK